jgi:hypothetical protein
MSALGSAVFPGSRSHQPAMKVLAVLSTIALPALVISGLYGMNLKE